MLSDSNTESGSEEEIKEEDYPKEEAKKPSEPFTNLGIEEDADDPKEPGHLDYKYIKSLAGPLVPSQQHSIKEGGSSADEKEKLVKRKSKNKYKPMQSVERKKYGGVRMCQRCLRTKPDRCHHCS